MISVNFIGAVIGALVLKPHYMLARLQKIL